MKSKVKPILDSQLSGLDWTPEETQNMLRQMRGETQVKKKLSLALVLALAITLLAATALAVTLWKNYYDKIAQNEGEIGYFDTWSGEKRAEFVLAMQAEGVNFDKEQIKKLEGKDTSDADKAQIATDLILNKYPGMREDTITAISILEAEKGILPSWSMEDKAAYTQMLVKTGTLGNDEEMYWMPGGQDIPVDKAVEIANEAIKKEFNETEESLKALSLYTELRSYADQPDERTWHVYYMTKGASVYDQPSQYSVWINSQTGELLSADSPARQVAEAAKNRPPQEILDMSQAFLKEFKEAAPYAMEDLVRLKADWTDRLVEMKKHTTDWGGLYAPFRNVVEQDIRLPEEGAIPTDQVWAKAEAAVLELPDWTKDKLDMYERYAEVYYHSKELGKPVYQLFFSQKSPAGKDYIDKPFEYYEDSYLKPLYALFGGENAATPRYVSIRLDATTGELTEAPVVGMLTQDGPPEYELSLIK